MNIRSTHSETDTAALLIVGASTRAAAASAVRAGVRPICVDQYGDQDLHAIARVIPRTSSSEDWLHELAPLAPMEWIFTGATENQRDLIAQISEQHALRGCDPDCLSRVRDPFFLETLLSENSIRMSPCRSVEAKPADAENWLLKPLNSAAGQGIQFMGERPWKNTPPGYFYLQRYQPGAPLSALYIAFPEAVVLVGVALQFCGNPALGAAAFQFCGGVTISPVPDSLRSDLKELGTTVARGCGIQGLFGCDLIGNPNDEEPLWLTEVNPRYTALTELFELQYRVPLMDWHLKACRSFVEDSVECFSAGEAQMELKRAEREPLQQIAKGILYAQRDRSAPEIRLSGISDDLYAIPESADLPYSDTFIPQGTPFCSVFGSGKNIRESLQVLAGRVNKYQRLLAPGESTEESGADPLTSPRTVKEPENPFFSGFSTSVPGGLSFLEESPD
ncbi:ATP-grasp domain-containing protein [Gimesia chilikensis]|uniref:ATP-grasp domain-containing protein n=1 Tax=Gimesia chilikensis TaxID=2605989 RepID=UPI0011EE0AF4|nr:ATP-grasp domain-containing protein [Gimesia chilikensis]KAA0137877.1 ATP-grasp domain-containing protein [Gimesia chilikensis]